MSRFDRYVLSQYLLFFGFFALVLAGVFWINRAVVLFDRLIADGQSALVFLEFSALALPNLIRMVLPIAVFASAVWVTNKLNGDSELTVLKATGTSPWQMARPVLAFGLLTGLMMSALTHYLLPASIKQLELREDEVARNVTAKLLTEGSFLHPAKGVAFFIRDVGDDGTLSDVFISDTRSSGETMTYTASTAYLVREGGLTNLILIDGMAQRLDAGTRRMSTTVFSDFSYDISALTQAGSTGRINPRTVSSPDLLFSREQLIEDAGLSEGVIAEELHLRIARAVVCVAVALVGFSALMVGGFSRFGVWRQSLLAFVLLIFVEGLRGPVSDIVQETPHLWPVMYLPSAAGLAFAAIFLQLAARPVPLRRGARAAA